MKTPEVRIYYSHLLDESVSVPLQKLYGGKGRDDASQLWEFTENYRQEWAKYADKILPALCDALGVEFYRGVIDAPCAPWVGRISDPLMMNFQLYPEQFVDQLMHELCHILLTDNTVFAFHSSEHRFNLGDRWEKLFGEQSSKVALYHIPVHALCKHVWLDVLKEPARLDRDIEFVKENVPYKTAWDYVQAHDYHEIIEQLRTDYRDMQKELV